MLPNKVLCRTVSAVLCRNGTSHETWQVHFFESTWAHCWFSFPGTCFPNDPWYILISSYLKFLLPHPRTLHRISGSSQIDSSGTHLIFFIFFCFDSNCFISKTSTQFSSETKLKGLYSQKIWGTALEKMTFLSLQKSHKPPFQVAFLL